MPGKAAMPKIDQCLITIDLAIALKQVVEAMGLHVPKGDRGFLCPACQKPVKPHEAGDNQAAHFEHLKWNPKCPLKHVNEKTGYSN